MLFVDKIIQRKDQEALVEWFMRVDIKGKIHGFKTHQQKLKDKIADHLWETYRL